MLISLKYNNWSLQRMWIKLFAYLIFLVTAYVSGVTADFSIAAPNIPVTSLTLNGDGSVGATDIVLTLGERVTSSVLYWNEIQDVLYGFNATVVSQSSECDTIPGYLGGDGFAFFVTTAISSNEILSTGGTLGLANKTNIAMAGLNFFTGQLNFKTTRDEQLGLPQTYYNVGAPTLNNDRCTGTPTTFQFLYSPPNLRIFIPALDIDYSFDWGLDINFNAGSKLYVGLSGATGEAYMKQNITQWHYTSVPPPEVTPFLECYEKVDSNTYRAHMGYYNPNISYVGTISATNGFVPDPQDRGQPQTFQVGRTPHFRSHGVAMVYQQGELELEIGAASPDTPNEPSAAESVQKFVASTANSTLINEVINPPGSNTTIEFISLSTKATGAEGTGSLVSAAPVTPPVAVPVNEPTSMTPTSVPRSVSSATTISNSVSLLLCIVLVRIQRAI